MSSQEIFDRIAGPLKNPINGPGETIKALEEMLERIDKEPAGEMKPADAPGWLTAMRDAKSLKRAVKDILEMRESELRGLVDKAQATLTRIESEAKASLSAHDTGELNRQAEAKADPNKKPLPRVRHEFGAPGETYIRVDSEARPLVEIVEPDRLPRSMMMPDPKKVQQHFKEHGHLPDGTVLAWKHGTRIHPNSGVKETAGMKDPA